MIVDDALPSGWQRVQLDRIAEVNPPRARLSLDTSALVPFVPMPAVSEAFGGIDVTMHRPFGEVQRGYPQFKSGDVLFAKITPCMENGKLAIVPELDGGHGYGSTEFHVLRAPDPVTARWVADYLSQEAIRRDARAHMTGTAGQLRVPDRWLRSLPLPIAPLQEQARVLQAVDELLSELNASVAALKRVRANLKRYRASVLKAAVEGRLTEQWRAEHPATETGDDLLRRILCERRAAWEMAELKRYAKTGMPPPKGWRDRYHEPAAPDVTKLQEPPEAWTWASVEQLVGRSEYGTSVKCSYDAKGPPVLRIPNIALGQIDTSDLKYSTQLLTIPADDALRPGDVLMCRTNGSVSLIGKAAAVRTELTPAHTFASYLLRFRLVEPKLSAMWFHLYVSSHPGRTFIERNAASSAGQHNISLSLIHRMPLPLPSTPEQAQIVAEVERCLSEAFKTEQLVGMSLNRAERLRQSILKRAFEGRLVPQDSNEEPVSALLARIQRSRMSQEAGSRKSGRLPQPKTGAARRGRSTGQLDLFRDSSSASAPDNVTKYEQGPMYTARRMDGGLR